MIKKYLFLFVFFAMNFSLVDAQNTTNQGSLTDSNSELYIDEAMLSPLEVDELLVIDDVSPRLSKEGRKPLILIHGWSFEGKPAPPGGGFWDNFKSYLLSNQSLSENFKPYYVRYWSNYVSVQEIAAELRKKMEEAGLHQETVVLMGHSMGGLVSRSYMLEQNFTQGIAQGEKCGNLVDRLITLGTPHHGSPMANGPARDDKMTGTAKTIIGLAENFLFKETTYRDVNRSDLRWDNFDGTFNYTNFPDERNTWLENLNTDTRYDSKMVCYIASVEGEMIIFPPPSTLEDQYKLGAWLIEQGFDMENDGIVPVISAGFDGHDVHRRRHFLNHNHADIVRGRGSDGSYLFDYFRTDLLEVKPLQLTWPDESQVIYLKDSEPVTITWKAPDMVSRINIYLSTDGGNSYERIAQNVDAKNESYTWTVPQLNSSQCLIKVANAQNEFEQATTKVPFTIYYNNIEYVVPNPMDQFKYTEQNEIVWQQEGLGQRVQIIYRDTGNGGIEKILADNYPVSQGLNTFVMEPDTSLQSSSSVYFRITILGMDETYGDTRNYSFASERIQMLGKPELIVRSPLSNPVDFYGVEGEVLEIGQQYSVMWRQKGDIRYVEMYLCNSNKEIVELIGAKTVEPGADIVETVDWVVTENRGDIFYFMAKAGMSSEDLFIEEFSERTVRINSKVNIVNPQNDAQNIGLHACFELAPVIDATQYVFELYAGNDDPEYIFQSDQPQICIDQVAGNELIAGQNYTLSVYAFVDTLRLFSEQIDFTCEETKPYNFTIVSPANNDEIPGENVDVTWTYAPGVSTYSIELYQQGNLIASDVITEPTDTMYTLPIALLEYSEFAEIMVSANNQYGSTTKSVTIERINDTGIKGIENENSNFVCYPNPVNEKAVFSFYVKNDAQNVTLSVHTLSGQKIETLFSESRFRAGTNVFEWSTAAKYKPGVYVGVLKSAQRVSTTTILIK